MPRGCHYCYVSFRRETKQFYIGCRSAWNLEDDTQYVGSGVWITCMRQLGINLEKEVLKVFPDRKEALRVEGVLIERFRNHPLCMNSKAWLSPVLAIPEPPDKLSWPPQYHDTQFWRRRHGLKVYLETHWAPFIEQGMVDMMFLRAYYPSTAFSIYRFETVRTSGRKNVPIRNELPTFLRVPRTS